MGSFDFGLRATNRKKEIKRKEEEEKEEGGSNSLSHVKIK